MKKIFYLILTLPLLAVSCDKEKEPVVGTMKGVFYADIPGEKTLVELAPDASKTYSLRACAQGSNVSDAVMNFTFKADPELVDKYNGANGTNYRMCPGSAYEFVTNEVMMPRYGKSSTTAKVKVTASGLEDGVDYILPVTIDGATGTDNWAVADTLAAYVLLRKSAFDPLAPGTEGNPYVISTVDDLKAMGSQMIEGSLVYFVLENDIDMSGVSDWEPVNTFEPYKKFDFNGKGHTISNFTGTTSLFGAVVGKLYDLTVSNANITNAAGPVGILGAYGGSEDAPVEVNHVYVSGKLTNTVAHGTGGLFGVVIGATIDACSADVTIASTKYDSGGIYGYDNSKAPKHTTVSNCWSAGDISGNRMVGGIAGNAANNAEYSEVVIRNCYSTAKVHANFKYGGIVGDAAQGQKTGEGLDIKNHIENCIAWNEAIYSDVTDDGVHYSAGAIVGFTSVKNYLKDCKRKADLNFSDCPGNSFNVLYNQENATPETPLIESVQSTGGTNYNFPYHGKAAAEGATASQVAKELGWDESVWDLSGTLPFFKGASAPVENPDVNPGGQLPDFDEHEFYN
ncbi:MAG: DUF1735 domain-containing protein [Bacteroidales bacterium]|nr:DUF1735 domain-containing protein [Bacteroidales bacterium]MBR2227972.1 DUF1735 domain-containing protein [Bacteroidales bacterium]